MEVHASGRTTWFVGCLVAALLLMPISFALAAVPLLVSLLAGWEQWQAAPQPMAQCLVAFIGIEVLVAPWLPAPRDHLLSLIATYGLWLAVWWLVATMPLPVSLCRRLWAGVAGSGVILAVIGLLTRAGLRGRWHALPVPWEPGTWALDLEWSPRYGPVASGVTMNPNVLAALLVLIWPITMRLALSTTGWRRIGWALGCLLQCGILFLTGSRGAVLAWTAVTLTWAVRDRAVRRALGGLCGGLAIVVVLSWPWWQNVRDRVPTILDRHLSSNTVRFSLLHSGVDMLRDRPLTGFGVDGFTRAYARYRYPEDTYDCPHLHDWYLQVAVESGLPAAVLFFAALIAMIRQARRADSPAAEASLGFAVYSLNDYLFHDPRVSLVAWVVWALGCRMQGATVAAETFPKVASELQSLR